jgi:hypothetical protein
MSTGDKKLAQIVSLQVLLFGITTPPADSPGRVLHTQVGKTNSFQSCLQLSKAQIHQKLMKGRALFGSSLSIRAVTV